MSAFVIVDISVKNEMAYQEYIAEITPSVAAYNGKYLVRGGKPQTLDGNWQSSRIVIMEYPSRDRAIEWLEAEELRAIHDKRRQNSHYCNMIVCDSL